MALRRRFQTCPALEAFNAILAEREATVAEAEPILNGLSDGSGHLALPEYITLREKMFRYVSMLRSTSEPEIEVRYREHVLAMRAAALAGKHDEITVHYRWLAQRVSRGRTAQGCRGHQQQQRGAADFLHQWQQAAPQPLHAVVPAEH